MESKQINDTLKRYFFDIPVACPYGLPFKAVYRQALFWTMPAQTMELFLEAGYRRNGNNIYTMCCRECSACVPIRLRPAEFKPNRNQKRVWGKNNDVKIETGPLQANEENIDLCNRFLEARYPGLGNSAEEYYEGFFLNSITSSFEIRYRADGHLIGVAIIDMGLNSLNAVYFYFDPEARHRSPGTFNILYLADFCRQQQLDYLYLGYWIGCVRAMRYKANFNPHYLLVDGQWVPVTAG